MRLVFCFFFLIIGIWAITNCVPGNLGSFTGFNIVQGTTLANRASQAFSIASGNGFVYTTGNYSVSVTFGSTTLTTSFAPEVFVVRTATNTPTHSWAVRFASNGPSMGSYGASIAVDSTGVYVTGAFSGTVNFTSIQLTSSATRSLFVAKLHPTNGSTIYAFSIPGTAYSEGRGIAVDSTGAVYVTGNGLGSTTLGGNSVTLSGGFVLKLTSAGVFEWINQGGSVVNDVSVDAQNNVYVSGYFQSTLSYAGAQIFDSAIPIEGFALKLNTAGALQWSARFGNQVANDIVANTYGVYITGTYSGTAQFGSMNSTATGSQNSFVINLSPATGAITNSVFLRSNLQLVSNSISLDPTGNVYVAGFATSDTSLLIGPQSFTLNSVDAFLVKYNPDINHLVALAGGGSNAQYFLDAVYDSLVDDIVVAGYFTSSASFGFSSATSSAPNTAMLVFTTQSCSACRSGSAQSLGGFYQCTSCTIGSFASGSENAVCTNCTAGTSNTFNGASSCSPCSTGTFSNTAGSRCVNCPLGTYAASTGSTSCSACPAGTTTSNTGASSLSACQACFAGEYLASSNICEDCPAGNFSSSGATSCQQCPEGTRSGVRSSSCTSCTAGTFSAAGSSSCASCPAGTFSAASAASCTTCPAGSRSSVGSSSCTTCTAGTFAAAGSGSCTSCPAGTFAATTGASSCATCPAGSRSNAGSSSCVSCSTGTYAPAGSGTCIQCPAGFYNDKESAAACIPCPAGTYVSTTGSSRLQSCTKCTKDREYSYENATKCEECPYFCCLTDRVSCHYCKDRSTRCDLSTPPEKGQGVTLDFVLGSYFGTYAGLAAVAVVLVLAFSICGLVVTVLQQKAAAAPAVVPPPVSQPTAPVVENQNNHQPQFNV